MQRVLTRIDTDRADNSDVFLAGHGVLLVLFKLPAQADPVGCSGQEHGRSIPFATFRCDAELGRYRGKPDIEQVAPPSTSLAR